MEKLVTLEFGGKIKEPHGSLAPCTKAARKDTIAQVMKYLLKAMLDFLAGDGWKAA